MNRTARYGTALYGVVFLVFGLYACLLLWAAINGYQNTQNTVIAACGVIFIVRAFFEVRRTAAMFRGGDDMPPFDGSHPVSTSVLAAGDVIVVTSLALTAYRFWTNPDRLNSPVAPFGLGLVCAYLIYPIGFLMRFKGK